MERMLGGICNSGHIYIPAGRRRWPPARRHRPSDGRRGGGRGERKGKGRRGRRRGEGRRRKGYEELEALRSNLI
uniref:Uncharacterized protein n=1 Tax=Oryza sativa subsp. japonica TaxID=39947 RepID=Q6K3X4_ORYSJ|nr:hypothetical protein [Oryza sativa Japonica Group]